MGHVNTLLDSGNASVLKFNAMLANPELAIMEKHVSGILTNVDGITYTTNALFTKASHPYLHPSTNPFSRGFSDIKPFLIPMAQVGGAVVIAVH
jgi:hypothetical protein